MAGPTIPSTGPGARSGEPLNSALYVIEGVILPDLRGIEFDWFASDSEGNLALFATAGEGFFPESVANNHVLHTSISEAMPTPHLGTPNIWEDYAALGLFVFDWALPGGPYKKVASPQKSPNQELVASVIAISDLPQFAAASFHSTHKVESWP